MTQYLILIVHTYKNSNILFLGIDGLIYTSEFWPVLLYLKIFNMIKPDSGTLQTKNSTVYLVK